MLELSDRKWTDFRVGNLFSITTGKAYNKNKMDLAEKGLRHVSRATSNHGIDCYAPVEDATLYVTYPGNCITVSSIPYTDGTCAFYQNDEFCCGVGVNILTSPKMTRQFAQFICTCINHAVVGKYGMARSLGATMLSNELISLPVDNKGQPDYDFIEQYIAEREPDYSWATGCIEPNAEISLSDREWAEFKVTDLFPVYCRGRRLKSVDRIPGKYPMVTGKNENYGVDEWIGNENQKKFSNAITINMFGTCAYREQEFCCDDHVIVLQGSKFNKWQQLFIVPLLQASSFKYSYGNQYMLEDVKTHTVLLPITPDGTPDYDFMEQYMKSLPFSKVLE